MSAEALLFVWGEPEYWAAVVRPGTVLYEIGGVNEDMAKICFARLAHKMPIRVRFIRRPAAYGGPGRSLQHEGCVPRWAGSQQDERGRGAGGERASAHAVRPARSLSFCALIIARMFSQSASESLSSCVK
jgi:hypothetical protein